MSDFYDDLETRSAGQREAEVFEALRKNLVHAKANAPYFSRLLADVNPEEVTDRAALARLPVTRKSELTDIQAPGNPLGGLTATPGGGLKRVYQSPGPTYDPEGFGDDWWRTARALYAAGFRAGEVMHNTFAYHFTPAGLMLESGAHALGCSVVPAGAGNTDSQARAISDVRPHGYSGAPSFLKIILERADDLGLDASSISKAVVAAEPFLPEQRAYFKDRGVEGFNVYASADLGCLAYESRAHEGMIVDEGVLIEIVRPGTGEPVPEGEVGEVVASLPFNTDYPLVRFATGDLSAVMTGLSPCGRTNMRLKGWMGRADQTTKVKGMFVHPRQVAEVVARHGEISKARLVVVREGAADVMTLMCESESSGEGLAGAIAESLQAVTKLKGRAELVTPGSLANDGKVIEDAREG